MKNLFFGLITICIFAFSANAQTKFVRMELPKDWQGASVKSETITEQVKFKSKSGREMSGEIRFTIPDEGNGLLRLEFSENILLDGGIRSNYLVTTDVDLNQIGTDFGTCIASCNDKYTDSNGNKIPGRGKCKASCWVIAIIKVVSIII